MTICPDCSHANPTGLNRCAACGASLAVITSCPKCGTPTQVDAKFCGQCGKNLLAAVVNSTEPMRLTTLEVRSAPTVRPDTRGPATQLQQQTVALFHLQTDTVIELPQNLSVIHIGKPNDRVPPDLDFSMLPRSDIVSRVHADIQIEGNVFFIEDVGSSNGTYVNEMQLLPGRRHQLQLGDRIAFGKGNLVTFLFHGADTVITLTLLHPVQSTPVQSWSFEHHSVIRIGRAVDNQVVLYSAVVSRYHVELRYTGLQWEVVNIGTNGTYLDGKRVQQAPLTNGSMIRLARSGPNIQVGIDVDRMDGRHTVYDPDQTLSGKEENGAESVSGSSQVIESVPATTRAQTLEETDQPSNLREGDTLHQANARRFQSTQAVAESIPCQHERAEPGALVCIDCGLPLNPSRVIGEYQVLKPLGMRGSTFVAWHKGHIVVLKTLRAKELEQPELIRCFFGAGRSPVWAQPPWSS